MAEDGDTWGDTVGYAGRADYANWCETWVWEQRELGEAAVCAENLSVFEDGDCEAYAAAWSAR